MSDEREPGWYWTKMPSSGIWVPDYWSGKEWEDQSMNDSYFFGETMVVGPKIEEPKEE